MVATMITSVAQCYFCVSPKTFPKQNRASILLNTPSFSNTTSTRLTLRPRRRLLPLCFFNAGKSKPNSPEKEETELEWPILKRWEVPWEWQTISLTSLACGLSFVLTGLLETTAIPYLGISIRELSLDEKAELLFVDQGFTTIAVLGVLYGVANTFRPLPEDLFRYDLKEPFNLKKGWVLWALIGLLGAVIAIALTGAVMSLFRGEETQRETDALVRLLPLIGSSSISTACLVGITGVMAPVLEETIFRGFFYDITNKVGSYTSCCNYQRSCICTCTSHSRRVSPVICTRGCSGIFICSNSQSGDSYHNPCILELGSDFTSYLSSVARV